MQDKNTVLEENQESLKLDYTIESPQERAELVRKIVESLPP